MQPTDQELYEQVKQRVRERLQALGHRWPSAYASGMLVRMYKNAMTKHGLIPFMKPVPTAPMPPLSRWFAEKWVDINTGKPCGEARTIKYYPVCRPTVRISSETPVTKDELPPGAAARMTLAKQKAGPARVQYADTYRCNPAGKRKKQQDAVCHKTQAAQASKKKSMPMNPGYTST